MAEGEVVSQSELTGRKTLSLIREPKIPEASTNGVTNDYELGIGGTTKEEDLEDIQASRDLLQRGIITQEEYEQELLGILGVERKPDGTVTLYHAVPIAKLISIITDRAIRPASQTGKRTWRTGLEEYSGEAEDIAKKDKVYLATKREVRNIAHNIQNATGEGTFILEVDVNEQNLVPDEDTHANNWVDSLADPFETCAYKGSISRFRIVARTEPLVDVSARENYAQRTVGASSDEERQAVQREFRNANEEVYKQENVLLQTVGVDGVTIPIIKQ